MMLDTIRLPSALGTAYYSGKNVSIRCIRASLSIHKPSMATLPPCLHWIRSSCLSQAISQGPDPKFDGDKKWEIRQAHKLPREFYQSLTWDHYPRFTLATDIDVYFCDPKSPWQRGTQDNSNRLLRQYCPSRWHHLLVRKMRKTNKNWSMIRSRVIGSCSSQAQLDTIARQLNERPGKTLMYQTPAEKFAQGVATTR